VQVSGSHATHHRVSSFGSSRKKLAPPAALAAFTLDNERSPEIGMRPYPMPHHL
jgi:hypothetical protein